MSTMNGLRSGQKVKCTIDDAKGTIIEAGYSAVKIEWEDGQIGVYNQERYAQSIEVLPEPEK